MKLTIFFLLLGECMGYGDPHYYDFNGNHFDHQGNCTYVLARDTSQNPPLYSVYINNVPCVDFPGTTCPKELIVEALGHRIYMLPNFTENYVSKLECLFECKQ